MIVYKYHMFCRYLSEVGDSSRISFFVKSVLRNANRLPLIEKIKIISLQNISVELERMTGLHQPEVSIAMKELKERDWIREREEKKPGADRAYPNNAQLWFKIHCQSLRKNGSYTRITSLNRFPDITYPYPCTRPNKDVETLIMN